MNTSPTARCGGRFERTALAYLQARGLQLETCNFRCRLGEIDLIMREGDITVFVEVRYRRSRRYGGALCSITRGKMRRVANTACVYLKRRYGHAEVPIRFDVVAIDGCAPTVRWIKSAFEF